MHGEFRARVLHTLGPAGCDDDGCAFVERRQRNGKADPGRSPDDDDALIFER
jgi:hypothetical protein